jgi:membrane-bound serine protease (ClpP class)
MSNRHPSARSYRFLQPGLCLQWMLLFFLPVLAQAQTTPAARPLVIRLELRSTIQPVSAEYLDRGIQQAAQQHASAVLVEMSTPGGLLDSTRQMVQHIEQSPVPVIFYIAPAGSRAGSAGFFLLEAADVAAMAPGTNAGAAHPILEGKTMDPVLKQKLENDAAAFLRSYVSRRGRNVQAAEDAVRNSKSYTDSEALQLHLIDLVAENDAALLQALDGRTITRLNGSTTQLHLKNAAIQTVDPTLRERLLGRLMDPNMAVLLLVVGGLLIYLEFNTPGGIVAGSIGTLLLVLALFALNLLPINLASVALLIASLVLLVLEAKFPSHGLLAMVGIACMVFGLMTLVNGPIPEMRVRTSMAIATGIGFGIITFLLTTVALRARRNKFRMGSEALIGETAVAQTPLSANLQTSGQVLVRGELWQANLTGGAAETLPAGETVLIRAVQGLTLLVEPQSKSLSGDAARFPGHSPESRPPE